MLEPQSSSAEATARSDGTQNWAMRMGGHLTSKMIEACRIPSENAHGDTNGCRNRLEPT